MASNFGLDVQVVSLDEIKERWPLINLEGAVGGVFLPNDGQTNPIDTTNALAAGARMQGARIIRNNRVTGISREANGEWRVATGGDAAYDNCRLCY